MEIPWNLVGATVHNAVCALALAPSMHTAMGLKDRCLNAVTGFVLLDCFDMLAEGKCKQQKLPTGSCFQAKQTVYNMQCVALTTAIMCLALPDKWDPWHHGQARVSEISIEQHFGHLRGMSPTAQLPARAYFYASARQAIKMGKVMNRLKPNAEQPDVKRLSDEEPLRLEFVILIMDHYGSFWIHIYSWYLMI